MVAVETLGPEPVGGGDHPERHISARFAMMSPKTAQSVGGCRGTGWSGNPASRAPPATFDLCVCSRRGQPAGEHYVADDDVRAGAVALLCRRRGEAALWARRGAAPHDPAAAEPIDPAPRAHP